MYLLECWIEYSARQLDRLFTYASDSYVQPWTRVRVRFGASQVTAFVESCTCREESKEELEQELGYRLQMVKSCLDQAPLVSEELHEIALWMKEKTCSSTISCIQAMLPAKMKPGSKDSAIVMENWVECTEAEASLTVKQAEAWLFVSEHQPLSYTELRRKYPSIARVLIDKGVCRIVKKERRALSMEQGEQSKALKLTPAQRDVFEDIVHTEDPVILLRGVTGSGKTEVYLHLADRVLKEGRQILMLVPEISLTPQMIDRVKARFGTDLAIYHSGLSAQEKYEQYQKVREGRARVVVGTRSAVFLPFTDLGLIVLDEEHDSSYKQENQPSYHCRDVAIERGRFHHCKVVLGSATPALESYARALKGVYHLVELTQRINGTLPKVTLVDLQKSMKNGESFMITQPLKEKIAQRLDAHEQVILLLNRRGYSSSIRCKVCAAPVQCPHCDLAMSYHRSENLLKCHTCGTVMPIPKVCPSCGERAGFSTYGYGTQRLQQEVAAMFPQARILRMDADTTSIKNGHEKILRRFENKEADILLGTQMIAKGLDYPSVTLVGVLNGDEGLSRTDYRSCEMTFDLLMQAGGRSGRANQSGEVVFQVFDPKHYAVQCAADADYVRFFKEEMKFRHMGMYPPYSYIISLTVTGKNQRKVDATSLWLMNALNGPYQTIGVISLVKIQDQVRERILLKGKDLDVMRRDLEALMKTKEYGKAENIRIDVNPMTLD